MAKKPARPGRTLIVFFVGRRCALRPGRPGGTGSPTLGLDLQGGTRITLIAEGRRRSPRPSLEEARSIIDQRVNG